MAFLFGSFSLTHVNVLRTSIVLVLVLRQCSLLSAYNQLIGKWHKIEVIIFEYSFEIQISHDEK